MRVTRFLHRRDEDRATVPAPPRTGLMSPSAGAQAWKPLGPAALTLMAAAVAVKQLLIGSLPLVPYAKQSFDDGWVLAAAVHMRRHEWLGDYNDWTLVKGPFSPWFVATCNRLGIPFMAADSILYSAACIAAVVALAPLLRSAWSRGILFVALLADPVSYASWTYQRLYRNGITMWQALFIISCLAAVWLRPKGKPWQLLLWSLWCGLCLGAMWNNREDSVWILPFVAVATVLLLARALWPAARAGIRAIRARTRPRGRATARAVGATAVALAIAVLPLGTLAAVNTAVRDQNEHVYGLACTTEITDSNCHFPAFMKALYEVTWDTTGLPARDDLPYAKLQYLYTLSPTLRSIKRPLNGSYRAWAGKKGYVENGMLIWPIRDGVQSGGYYRNADAARTDAFYSRVADEINAAIASGKAQSQPTMPSALMPPWHASYRQSFPRTLTGTNRFVLTFSTVQSASSGGSGPEAAVDEFEGISGDPTIVISKQDTSAEQAKQFVQPVATRADAIATAYGRAFPYLAPIAAIAGVIVLAATALPGERRRRADTAILLLGIAGSYAAIVGGVSYNQLASVNSTIYMYLSGAYPLLILGCGLAILGGAECLVSGLRDLRRRRTTINETDARPEASEAADARTLEA